MRVTRSCEVRLSRIARRGDISQNVLVGAGSNGNNEGHDIHLFEFSNHSGVASARLTVSHENDGSLNLSSSSASREDVRSQRKSSGDVGSTLSLGRSVHGVVDRVSIVGNRHNLSGSSIEVNNTDLNGIGTDGERVGQVNTEILHLSEVSSTDTSRFIENIDEIQQDVANRSGAVPVVGDGESIGRESGSVTNDVSEVDSLSISVDSSARSASGINMKS